MKYNYPRADLTIRISGDLLGMLHEAKSTLNVPLQDIAIFAILQTFDAGQSCPDWRTLSPVLK